MTALEFMEKQINYHRQNYERELVRGVPEDMLENIALKINYYEAAVDALRIGEVVRCKDCKHYHQYHVGKTAELSGWGKCKLIDMDVDMTVNDFCSHGERKDK